MIVNSIKDTDVIIIPEQHLWHKNLASAPKSLEDNKVIIEKIYGFLDELVNPTVLFIGDIFHRGVPNTGYSYPLWDYLRTINKKTEGRCYSVIGNHELSYIKDNIFWGAVDLQSDFAEYRSVPNYNLKETSIIIPDELQIGDVLYSFCHYGRKYGNDYSVPDGINSVVVLSHNSVLNSEISNALKDRGQDLKEGFIGAVNLGSAGVLPPTNKLKYVYVGHMHLAHGVFNVSNEIYNGIDYNFKLRYLASLGRTAHNEYTDDVLRQLPVHKIRNGKFEEEGILEIELTERKVSIDESIVAASQDNYERAKENRELKSIITSNINLKQNIEDYLEDKNPELMDLFHRAGNGSIPTDLLSLLNKYS